MILRNHARDPASFGIFGGGGRSGSFTFGRDGRSGRSGREGIGGIIDNAGNASAAEASPIVNDGRFGSLIGEIRGSKFGMEIDIPRRISERSRIISGHLGKVITGIEGTITEISLSIQ